MIQILEAAKKHIDVQIDTVNKNTGTLQDIQIKLAQGTYSVLEKMGVCLGVLMPTRHQSVLESIFQKVHRHLERLRDNQDFGNILAGNVDSNDFYRQKVETMAKQLAETQEKFEREMLRAE